MARHAGGARPRPESTLILILMPLQTPLPRSPLRRRISLPLPPLLLPTRQRSQGVPELRMLQWDESDAWPQDCVRFEGASGRRVRRWLVGGM